MGKAKKNMPTILVCCSSRCKENKSGKVAKALEKEIANAGLEERLRVKKSDCLGRCKNCPVVEFSKGDLSFEGVKPKDAPKMLAKIAAAL